MYHKRVLLAIACISSPLSASILWLSPLGIAIEKIAERQYRQQRNRDDQDHFREITTKDGEKFRMPDQSDDEIVGQVPDEVVDIIDFLRNPQQFRKFGALMPRGVLFVGPPGTGKTSMARKIAREAGADFIVASGSEFVNKYVGVGADNVRKLFDRARSTLKEGKCKSVIIFIDEIDALGSRSETDGGGAVEYNQTLNQILTELDGFKSAENILVIAATNREDVLDAALLRPGRFDRRAYFKLPDENDRLTILKHYCKNRPINQEIDLTIIAQESECMSGADLKNIVNEAAIEAAREKGNAIIAQRHFDIALQKAQQRKQAQNRSTFRRR